MEYHARKLHTDRDLAQVLAINGLHSRVMRAAKIASYDEDFERVIRERYFGTGTNVLVGGFEDDRLINFVGFTRWKWGPWATMTNHKMRPGFRVTDENNQAMIAMWQEFFRLTEAEERYRIWFLRPLKGWPRERMGPKFFETNSIWQRYSIVVEEVIKAGNQSPYALTKEVMGGKAWPMDLALESAQLKQRFRSTASLRIYGSE